MDGSLEKKYQPRNKIVYDILKAEPEANPDGTCKHCKFIELNPRLGQRHNGDHKQ